MNEKLKIVQMLPALHAGGVECTVLELAAAVVRAGHESLVISAGGRMKDGIEADGSRHITMEVGKKRISSLFMVRKIRALFEELAPDIIHVHSRVPAWIAYLAWKKMNPRTRPRFMTTVHGLYSINAYSAIMAKGERVITVSECAKRYVLDSYPRTDPALVQSIPLGVDPSVYYPGYQPSEEWKKNWFDQYPELKGKWVLCLPGRLTSLKGHADFFQVLKILKEKDIPVHGLVVGEAHKRKKDYAASLPVMVKELGLEDRVTFTGHRTDLRDVLAVSDVVLSLTIVPESFGRTTLESLALGKATLGYAHGGVEEQLDVFLPAGKVPVRDVKAAAARLAAWYSSPPELPGKILPPYQLADMTEAHLSVYSELAEARQG